MPKVRLESLSNDNIGIESSCCVTYDPEFIKLGAIKKKWVRAMMKKGLRAQILFEDDEPAGFIEYQPIELPPCPALGQDLYFINCIMVHLWDLGPGSKEGKGYGRMLLEAAQKDLKANTKAKGIVAWGLDHEFWFMPFTFFRHAGFEEVDREGQRVLLVKKFRRAEDPRFRPVSFVRDPEAGKAVIDVFYSAQCPFRLGQLARWEHIAKEFDQDVIFNKFLTDQEAVISAFGISSGLFVNGEQVLAGPMSDDEIRDKVSAAVERSREEAGWLD